MTTVNNESELLLKSLCSTNLIYHWGLPCQLKYMFYIYIAVEGHLLYDVIVNVVLVNWLDLEFDSQTNKPVNHRVS